MTSIGQGFPLHEALQSQVKDAITISNTGNWWTAVLLIEDPFNSDGLYIALYRWQRRNGEWKRNSCIKLKNQERTAAVISALENMAIKMK